MAILGITSILAVAFTPQIYRPINRFTGDHGKLHHLLLELEAMGGLYRRRILSVLVAIGMAMINHGLNILAFYLVATAIFPSIPSLVDHFLIVPLVLFSTAIPLPFGALGVSEQVSDILFALVDHPGGAISVMGFRILMYGSGAISLVITILNLSQVRSLRADAATYSEVSDEEWTQTLEDSMIEKPQEEPTKVANP